jgi:DNA-binding CsgD family transcriptional regulator
MRKRVLVYLFVLSGVGLSAQIAISGQLNLEEASYEPKVLLEKLHVDHIDDLKEAEPIAWSPVNKDGFFSFDKKHLSNKDAVYRIYVNRMETALKDTIASGTTFILSKSDKIIFQKSRKPFTGYTTTNEADKEWKKLQAFEKELLKSQLAQDAGENQFKSYAKDSLRILMVKLIGVKQLEEKGLLEQDITKNSDFYLVLLAELKASEMPAKNYVFLENRLAFLTQDALEESYTFSKIINYILGFMVLGLVGFVVLRKRKEPVVVPLSRQEQNIQNLIVQGKTNKEIANELFISISTVKTHITNIYSKLKVSGRQELLRKMQN